MLLAGERKCIDCFMLCPDMRKRFLCAIFTTRVTQWILPRFVIEQVQNYRQTIASSTVMCYLAVFTLCIPPKNRSNKEVLLAESNNRKMRFTCIHARHHHVLLIEVQFITHLTILPRIPFVLLQPCGCSERLFLLVWVSGLCMQTALRALRRPL